MCVNLLLFFVAFNLEGGGGGVEGRWSFFFWGGVEWGGGGIGSLFLLSFVLEPQLHADL